MINDYDKGGLKVIDIQSLNTSLKMRQVLKVTFKNDDKLFVDFHFQMYGGKAMFLSNL